MTSNSGVNKFDAVHAHLNANSHHEKYMERICAYLEHIASHDIWVIVTGTLPHKQVPKSMATRKNVDDEDEIDLRFVCHLEPKYIDKLKDTLKDIFHKRFFLHPTHAEALAGEVSTFVKSEGVDIRNMAYPNTLKKSGIFLKEHEVSATSFPIMPDKEQEVVPPKPLSTLFPEQERREIHNAFIKDLQIAVKAVFLNQTKAATFAHISNSVSGLTAYLRPKKQGVRTAELRCIICIILLIEKLQTVHMSSKTSAIARLMEWVTANTTPTQLEAARKELEDVDLQEFSRKNIM